MYGSTSCAARFHAKIMSNVTRTFLLFLPAIAAAIPFVACVDLTQPRTGRADAGNKGGQATDAATSAGGGSTVVGPDAANGGSGGSAAGGGLATGAIGTGGAGGIATTGGAGGAAVGGAAGSMAGATSSDDGGIDAPSPSDLGAGGSAGTDGTSATGGASDTGGTSATGGTITSGGKRPRRNRKRQNSGRRGRWKVQGQLWGLGWMEANRHARFWHDYTPAEIGQPLCGGVDPRSRTRFRE